MRNIPVFSNRLDESNGIVENVLEMKAKKTPWHLRFAPKAKGLVSFVQNLLSPPTQKEGVRGGQLSAFFQSATAAIVGIALLVGSIGEVHGQSNCYPPIFDVCLHKDSGRWESSSGLFEVDIEFRGKRWQRYEVVWHGLKKIGGNETYADVSKKGVRWDITTLSYDSFYWDHTTPWTCFENYGCTIYEGYFDWNNPDENGRYPWIRGDWVASVDFNAFHQAASVSIDNSASGLDFGLSSYYCSIDWEPILTNPLYGYREDFWAGHYFNHPNNVNGYVYWGNVGTPRFHYLAYCPVDIPWPTPPASVLSPPLNPRDLFRTQ